MSLSKIITEILALEAAAAEKEGDTYDGKPGRPAKAAQIAAAEKSRGRKFPAPYREFLHLHDGWTKFAWGMSLYSTAELTGKKYSRGYIEDMVDDEEDRLTPEVLDSLVIGSSENDASLLLLAKTGAVLEWRYEVERRHKDFAALLADRAKVLRSIAKQEAKTERAIEQSWDPQRRARGEAALAKDVRAALAKAPRLAPAAAPKRTGKQPAAVKPTALTVSRKKKIIAEVTQHLVLYLGAYPSAYETLAAYRAFSVAYPVKGAISWMPAGDMFPEDSEPDEATLAAALRVRNGAFGLRVGRDVKRAGGPAKYVINVVGAPPTSDSSELPRSSFCEVIVPASESPETLFALAEQLLTILPVRSGHGGYAAYIWDEEAEPDPLPEIFTWCRRFWGVDIGTVEGWLPGTVTRLHGASWLTILGPAFATELERAKRLDFTGNVELTGDDRGTIIRAGASPSLGDIARGEFSSEVAQVEAAIAPLLMAGYDARSWVNFSGTVFDTRSEDLLPMRSHHATAMYVSRLLDPAGWLAPTPRERVEAVLADLAKRYKRPDLIKEWAAEARTYIPSFESLLRIVQNATVGHVESDEATAALELLIQFSDCDAGAYTALLSAYLERKTFAKALPILPAALERAKEHPSILHNVACIHAELGDFDRAMAAVVDAKKYHYDEMAKLRDEPVLAPLHKRAAWQRVFKTSRRA